MSSQTLQLLTPGLTGLQAAAVKRIEEFQRELATYGMYVRTGVELKFTTQDEEGNPAPRSIRIKNAGQYLRASSPYIQDFGHSDVLEHGELITPSKYQVKFLDNGKSPPDDPVHPESFSPVAVAEAIGKTRRTSLPAMLMQTTYLSSGQCLSSPLSYAGIEASFLARPHPEFEGSEAALTSGMHINMSLYNKRGDNLFAGSPLLAEHCAIGVANVQRHAALGFLPSENSLARIGANKFISNYVNVGYGKHKDQEHSINIRATKGTRDETRLENRMPGADADPYVAIALTMAGIVDAVRRNLSHGQPKDRPGDYLMVDDTHMLHLAKKPAYETRTLIPRTRPEVIQQIIDAKDMRGLLGAELHEAIVREYGQDHEAAR